LRHQFRLPIIASFLENHLLQISERLRTACVCLVWRVKLRSLRCKKTNGAGKTTALRILTTLSRPDGGWARVAGHNVVREAAAVQRNIGVTAQDATVDEVLTGRQNLVMIGRLSGLRRRQARARAAELLDQFDLADAADRILREYSGGMRRRLDLAAGLPLETGSARMPSDRRPRAALPERMPIRCRTMPTEPGRPRACSARSCASTGSGQACPRRTWPPGWPDRPFGRCCQLTSVTRSSAISPGSVTASNEITSTCAFPNLSWARFFLAAAR